MKGKSSAGLKFIGILTILFGLIYAVLGTLALVGTLTNILPGHEKGEVLVVVLAYGVALLAIIGGIAAIRGSFKAARLVGVIFAILGVVSLVYVQLTQDAFNIWDVVAAVLGATMAYLAHNDMKLIADKPARKFNKAVRETTEDVEEAATKVARTTKKTVKKAKK